MSIADELREYALSFKNSHGAWSSIGIKLDHIADRIDAEHEEAIQQALMSEGGVPETDENMAKHGWIRLPKDADGEYIQPSDIPHLTKVKDGMRLAYYPSLELRQDGTWRFAGWTPDRYRIIKPTVEDVLRKFAQEMNENLGMYTGEAIDADEWRDADAKTVTKYAAKLRLAEVEDA